jgi:hypothetical protein
VSHDLPATYDATRAALHQLACYVLAPARLAQDERISLQPVGDGFGTPPIEGGSAVRVSGADLVIENVDASSARSITTLRDAAEFVGVALDPRPPVGADLPPFEPDSPLEVDRTASIALGAWYRAGLDAIQRLVLPAGSTVGSAELWPEHFDLAVVITPAGHARVNIGFSPGDDASDEPYVYVGPFERRGLVGNYWNAPFGALRRRSELLAGGDLVDAAVMFIDEGLARSAGDRST